MQQTFTCPKCGAQNNVGQRFCVTCGQMFQYACLHCKNIADPASKFCPHCGGALPWHMWQQPQQLPQQPPPPASAPSQPPPAAAAPSQPPPPASAPIRLPPPASAPIRPPPPPPPLVKPRSSSKSLVVLLVVFLLIVFVGSMFWFSGYFSESGPALPESESPAQTPAVSEKSGVDPPYLKEPNLPVQLINNPDARDVTFAELETFLLKDNTDDEIYVVGVRTCGNFAEKLHNNAEEAEIRAAFVAISFVDDAETPHALNAFQTTDRGLVYVDCIGEGLETVTSEEWLIETNPCENDKVAYVEIGEEYGVISIDKAESLQYSFYVEYTQDWQTCKDMLEDYNAEVARYNEEISGKVYYEGSPELAAIELWEAELAEKEIMIDEMAEGLGDCWFAPLGTVERVEIYW